MKKCSYCGAEYPDDTIECAIDRTPLSLSGTSSKTDAIDIVSKEEKPLQAIEAVEFETDVLPDGEAALCLSCLFPNLPDSRWCKRCGAPMSSIIGIEMPDAAQAVGFVYRRAVEAPPNFWVFCGIWLTFFPGLVSNALAIRMIFYSDIEGLPRLALLWLAVGLCALCASMLYRVTRNCFTMKSEQP